MPNRHGSPHKITARIAGAGDAGAGKALTTTTGRKDVYAFIFEQQGLMAGIGIQGSKITKLSK